MDIVLRASVMFFALFLLVRIMGKRELAQMTSFELIVLVVFGDLVQQGVTHNDFSLTGGKMSFIQRSDDGGEKAPPQPKNAQESSAA